MNHIVLANAEYFSALRKGAPVGFRARVQMKMLVKARFSSENLQTAFVLALKFFVGLTFLRSSPLHTALRLVLFLALN